MEEAKKNEVKIPVSIKVIRMEFVLHKISRVMGLYSSDYLTDQKYRLEIVNDSFKLFLQATEYIEKPEVNVSQSFSGSGDGSPIKRQSTMQGQPGIAGPSFRGIE